jgi:hypothetical protein
MRPLSSCGKVNTRWKYPTGKISDFCLSSHFTLASDWHLGQWRLRQVIGGTLKATGVTPLDVAAQGRSAAAFHGLDDFEMRHRQRMVAAIGLAIGAKDIGQFNAASCRCRPLTGGQHGLGHL